MLVLSWLLYKWKIEFSNTLDRKPCQRFDWMLVIIRAKVKDSAKNQYFIIVHYWGCAMNITCMPEGKSQRGSFLPSCLLINIQLPLVSLRSPPPIVTNHHLHRSWPTITSTDLTNHHLHWSDQPSPPLIWSTITSTDLTKHHLHQSWPAITSTDLTNHHLHWSDQPSPPLIVTNHHLHWLWPTVTSTDRDQPSPPPIVINRHLHRSWPTVTSTDRDQPSPPRIVTNRHLHWSWPTVTSTDRDHLNHHLHWQWLKPAPLIMTNTMLC